MTLVSALEDIRKEFSPGKFNRLISMPEFQVIFNLYKEYCKDDNGPLKVFWNSYLEMVEVLMNFLRATREMLPCFFAYDHTNYARYLPVYLANMITLPETHPEAHALLENGDFGVQRTTSHGFSQMPVDQTIEQTLNRSTKTKGGIVGFSLRKGAVQRWMITAHARAAFVDKCRKMSTGEEESQRRLHKETGSARMKREEEDVKKVISSGYVTSDSIKQDLLEAKEKGATALTAFVEERIITNSTGIFETLPKLKLGSFRDTHKKTSVTAGDRNVMIRADRNLFARLLVIARLLVTEPPDGPEMSAVS